MNALECKDFLLEVEENGELLLLEEGKEKNDLIDSAKKRGILLVDNARDLGVFKTIYSFTNKANANGAILPEKEFIKVLPQLVGRPVNINHERKMIVGFYTDYKYIAKEKKAIAYGIFFKSVYPKLWEKAKELKKVGKLSTSFEIWSPNKLRKNLGNGNYELHGMQMAGGAFIFEENGNEPAFKNAKVLEMAKDLSDTISEECLVYASKYQDAEIVTAETILEKPVMEKIVCKHCQNEFLPASLDQVKLNCPNCKSIVDRTGVVLYPPQIKDYHVSCPICSGNFMVLGSGKDFQKVECEGCSKKYLLEFYSSDKPDALKLINFIHESETTCPQCGKVQAVDVLEEVDNMSTKCKKCGMDYPVTVKFQAKRKIKKISALKEDKIINKPKEDEELSNEEKIKLENAIKTLTKEVEDLKTKEKSTTKIQGRLNRVLMIAMELKGKLNYANVDIELKDKELVYTKEVSKQKDELINAKDAVIEKSSKQTKVYKFNAKTILERRTELGKHAKDMKDEEILDNKDYEIARLNKQVADKESNPAVIDVASEDMGSEVSGQDSGLKKIRDGIDEVAFGKKKNKK